MPDLRIDDPLLTPGVRPGGSFGVLSTRKRVGVDGTCAHILPCCSDSRPVRKCWDKRCRAVAAHALSSSVRSVSGGGKTWGEILGKVLSVVREGSQAFEYH
jgi:hypothetical protein